MPTDNIKEKEICRNDLNINYTRQLGDRLLRVETRYLGVTKQQAMEILEQLGDTTIISFTWE